MTKFTKPWWIAGLFLVGQTIFTFAYTNISVSDGWSYIGVAVLVLLCSLALNFLLSLLFAAVIACFPKQGRTFRQRFNKLLPVLVCVFAVVVSVLFVLTDYV